MQQAKREGEWFAVGALGGSIVLIYTAPAVITYGSVAISAEVEMLSLYGSGAFTTALATPFGQMALKSTIDLTAQGLFNDGKVNPVAAIVGGAVPGSGWGAAVKSGIASEATSLGMKYTSDPSRVSAKDILTSGVKSAIAAPGGMHMNNVVGSATGSSVAGEAGGAIFSNFLSSELENAK